MKEDRRLVASCISGQIYDSDPIDFTTDLGARLALHRSVLKVPGAAKLASFLAKGVTSSLDALFLTRFGSQQAEYLQTLYSSAVSQQLYYGFPIISFLVYCFHPSSFSVFLLVAFGGTLSHTVPRK